MSEHAIRIKRELVMKGTILDVYKDTMELPNGKTEEWDFVSHRKGAAAVVAVREDGKLLMVRQYRNALERMTLEIPALRYCPIFFKVPFPTFNIDGIKIPFPVCMLSPP